MLKLDAKTATNLALFGTPWGGGGRRMGRREERRREEERAGQGVLGSEQIPWFTEEGRNIVMEQIGESSS